MKKIDLFNANTQIVDPGDHNKTIKRAKINTNGYPRLEVHGKSKRLSNKTFGIGRDKRNALIISDPKVSKFHAIITFVKGTGYICDSSSSNGTYVNGRRIKSGKKTLLKNGDKIKVGSTQIIYYR